MNTDTTGAQSGDMTFAFMYRAARVQYHQTGDPGSAELSHEIADKAYDAGQPFDEITLDNEAREIVKGGPLS